MLRTGVSEKAVRRIMAEDGLTAHVPRRRRYSSYEGEPTPAPNNLADLGFTAERPNEKWLTDITGIKARDGKGVPLADDRLPRWQDRRVHGRFQSQRRARQQDAHQGRGNAAGGGEAPGAPDRGCHCRWPGWLDLMDRYGLTRSTGAKGCSPDNAAAEGFLGRMRTESVHPGHWEERSRDEVLVPIDDCIRRHDHERVKRSLGWMSPVQIPSKPGNGCVTISKKTSTAPP